ncbi:hypothetical protein Lfu02_09030 [Longispora fulva]|nr:hypothetical protein Lfu02_09030 [Longispora fulva]
MFAALAMVLAGLFVAVGPAQPAQAGSPCVPLYDRWGRIVGWDCPPQLWDPWGWNRPDPPCFCPDWVIEWRDLIDPERFLTDLNEGLSRERMGDTAGALDVLTQSAKELQGNQLTFGSVGQFYAEEGVYKEGQDDALADAGYLIASGERYLQKAMVDEQNAGYYNRLAMNRFDKAISRLMERRQ